MARLRCDSIHVGDGSILADRRWKRAERRVAGVLGGRRVPVSGRGDGPDVQHEWLSVEVKDRAALPKWLSGAMEQSRRAAEDGQLSIVVLHERGKHDSLVMLRLSDFVEWFVGESADHQR